MCAGMRCVASDVRWLLCAHSACGEFDNAGAMMSVDETLMCSFQILKPAEKKAGPGYASLAMFPKVAHHVVRSI